MKKDYTFQNYGYVENGKLQQECFNDAFPEQLEKRLEELRNVYTFCRNECLRK